MTETIHARGATISPEKTEDLRRVGISPDFWYPVALSADVRRGKTFAARFAGQRIVLYRGARGAVTWSASESGWPGADRPQGQRGARKSGRSAPFSERAGPRGGARCGRRRV